VVEELETGRPLAELVVRAFDRDLLRDDGLGYASTDAAGRFAIRFDTSRFQDVREERPDLYLRVFDKYGTRLLLETSDAIRWDAKLVEEYRLRVPARALGHHAG
jgi:carotenoid cleavage dioxygenase